MQSCSVKYLTGAVSATLLSLVSHNVHAASSSCPTSSVVATLHADRGKVDPDFLREQIEELEGTQRDCETNALVGLALGQFPAPGRLPSRGSGSEEVEQAKSVCLGRSRPSQIEKARFALGLLRKPWNIKRMQLKGIGTNEEATRTARSELYRSVTCLDRYPNALVSSEELRRIRSATEQALANIDGGYATMLRTAAADCDIVKKKTDQARAIRNRNPRSEIATKTLVVEMVADIAGASLVFPCKTYEQALRDTNANIEQAMDRNLLARSVEGWRWTNDLTYIHAAYSIALGNFFRAQAGIDALSKADIESRNGLYEKSVNPVASKLLTSLQKKRMANFEGVYQDQIFVYQPLPGYFRNTDKRVSRRFVANADVAKALQRTLDLAKTSPPANFPCRNQCSQVLDWVWDRMHELTKRTDLLVVTGSFQSERAAKNGLANTCATLRKAAAESGASKNAECDFSVSRVRSYHRVTSPPLDEEEANTIRDIFDSRKLPVFLSRPRVIDPL